MPSPLPVQLPDGTRVSNFLYRQMDPEELNQDVFSAVLPSGYRIDAGWFPENDPSGKFYIEVWLDEEQITSRHCNTALEAVEAIEGLGQHYGREHVSASRSSSSVVRGVPLPVS